MEIEDFIEIYDDKAIRQLVAMKVPTDDVADVVQEIYAQLAKSVNTFKGESSLATWVDRVIHNVIMTYFRRKNRLMDACTELTWEGDMPEGKYLPIVRVDVRDSLSFLPAAYQDVLIMRFWGGMSLVAIAGLLHLSYEAVRSRYRRGLASCRKNMDIVMDEFTGDRDIETEWQNDQAGIRG